MPDTGGGASRTTDPALGSSSATDVSLREFVEQSQTMLWRLIEERDRRYAEVQVERDKAEVLRAANQAYRDEKANELREQISSERGTYVSQLELKGALDAINATLKPILEFVSGQQGATQKTFDTRSAIGWAVAVLVGLVALYQFFVVG